MFTKTAKLRQMHAFAQPALSALRPQPVAARPKLAALKPGSAGLKPEPVARLEPAAAKLAWLHLYYTAQVHSRSR